jgi:outer membrane lipoprotein-sorting protein
MKPADDIQRLFQNAGLSTDPNAHDRVFADVLRAHQRTIGESPAQPARWRTLMKRPIMRYALAAVLLLVVFTGFTLFWHTGNVTWAIEQSIEALGKYNAVVGEGLAAEEALTAGDSTLRPVRMWAVADANQTTVEKYRLEMNGVTLLVTDGRKTWKYEPQAHRVTVRNRPYSASEYWLGSGFLEHLREARTSGILTAWQESSGRDPATGKPRITLRVAWLEPRWNGPRSLELNFDRDSKLLVGMQQWENASWEGPASIVIDKVTYYEGLPDDLFTFQIPPGATVIEK